MRSVFLFGRVTWNVMERRSDQARQEMAFTNLFVTSIAHVCLYALAKTLAAMALAELPDTDQSKSIRSTLEAFKHKMSSRTRLTTVLACSSVVVCVLHQYLICFTGFMCLLVILLSFIGNVLKVRTQIKKHRSNHGAGRSRMLQVLPVSANSSKSLDEWEAQGKRIARLPAASPEISGVSFALLKKLAEEKDIPGDWTMAQVCAMVVKPLTRFTPPAKSGARKRSGGECCLAGAWAYDAWN